MNLTIENDNENNIDALSLNLRDRTDVVIKYMYAAKKLNCHPDFLDDINVEQLYKQHIHIRTGGQEPGDEKRKGSLDDFVFKFNELIESFRSQGFMKGNEVPLSSQNNLLINGAHRVAICLALGYKIPVVKLDFPGGLWDINWFINAGFRQEDINIFLKAIAYLKPNNFLVSILWAPVEQEWCQIEKDINSEAPILFSRTLDFSNDAFDEMICDIYSFDWGPMVGDNILRKISLLKKFPPKARVVFSEIEINHKPHCGKNLKEMIRFKYSSISPIDHFTTIHVSESEAETNHLMNIFCSENNIFHLSRRKPLRPELVEMLANYLSVLRKNKLNPMDCCIVGGAAIDILGLRNATDIDFTLRESIRFSHFNGGVTNLEGNVDVVAHNYARSFSAERPLTDDQIIKRSGKHFFSRGLKFVDPVVAITRRQHQRRDKDLRDLKLLAKYLDQ